MKKFILSIFCMAFASLSHGADVKKIMSGPEGRLQYYPNFQGMTIGDLGLITQILNNGTLLGGATWFNFTGGGCTASVTGGTATITCTGGGGGGGGAALTAGKTAATYVAISSALFPDFNVTNSGTISTFTITNATNTWTAPITVLSSVTFSSATITGTPHGLSFTVQNGTSSFDAIDSSTITLKFRSPVILSTASTGPTLKFNKSNTGFGSIGGAFDEIDPYVANASQGSITGSAWNIGAGTKINNANGAANATSYSFSNCVTCGLFLAGGNKDVGMATNGVERQRWFGGGGTVIISSVQTSNIVAYSSVTTAEIEASTGILAPSATFYYFDLSGGTQSIKDGAFNLVFDTAPTAGQKLSVLSVSGANVHIGGGGDQIGSGGTGGGEVFGYISTRAINMNGFGISNSTGLELGQNLQLTTYMSTVTVAIAAGGGGVNQYYSSGPLTYSLVVGTQGAVGVDVFVTSITNFNLILSSFGANGLTTSATGYGQLFFRDGVYKISNATVPAGVTIVCGSSVTFVDELVSATQFTVYGKMQNCNYDMNGIRSAKVIRMKSSSQLTGFKIYNFPAGQGSAAAGTFGYCTLCVEASSNVKVQGEFSNFITNNDSLRHGDEATFMVLDSTNVDIQVNPTFGTSIGNSSTFIFFGRSKTVNYHDSTFLASGGNAIVVGPGNQDIFFERNKLQITQTAGLVGHVVFTGDSGPAFGLVSTGTISISYNDWDIQTSDAGNIFGFDTGGNGRINGIRIKNNTVHRILGTGGSYIFANLASTIADGTIFQNNNISGLNTFISDSGNGTLYNCQGNTLYNAEVGAPCSGGSGGGAVFGYISTRAVDMNSFGISNSTGLELGKPLQLTTWMSTTVAAIAAGGGGSGGYAMQPATTSITISTTAVIQSLTEGTSTWVRFSSSGTCIPDAYLANMFEIPVNSDFTINGPIHPVNNMSITFRVIQEVQSHTVTWATGAGNFSYGTDIPAINLSSGGSKEDYIRVIFCAVDNRWHVVSIIRGF